MSSIEIEQLRPDPVESAEQAGLRYVSDEEPGFQRKPWGRGVTYLDEAGEHIKEPEVRQRLEALAIPPAWTEVWICPDENGHILATGRDDQGRKQYIYHPKWREVRNEAKFHRLIPFGRALPALRAQIERDLSQAGLPRAKVLSAVVKLLDGTLIRVGNREYVRQNEHFGLTTLRDQHVQIKGATIHFEFTGKSGKELVVEIADRRLAGIVKACRDVPGHHLFQYVEEDGTRQGVSSGDVNEYLREVTGADFTAKDFRTWGGTVSALAVLCDGEPCTGNAEVKQKLVAAVDAVAEQLGNTRAVCREYYIHSAILRRFEEGALLDLVGESVPEIEGLHPDESRLLALLERLDS